MSKRDVIKELRGEVIDRVVARVEWRGDVYELLGYGYENYPEPQYYYLRINGTNVLRNDSELFTSYWDDEVILQAQDGIAREMLFDAGVQW
jgi:hypothetical protein